MKLIISEQTILKSTGGITWRVTADEQMKAELYQQVGKLQVELDWLKKKSGMSR